MLRLHSFIQFTKQNLWSPSVSCVTVWKIDHFYLELLCSLFCKWFLVHLFGDDFAILIKPKESVELRMTKMILNHENGNIDPLFLNFHIYLSFGQCFFTSIRTFCQLFIFFPSLFSNLDLLLKYFKILPFIGRAWPVFTCCGWAVSY